ncbi:MAG TPA: nucleoside 2-deoxyribosyltransferase [Burkholderiaceae bacterium]|nr:nucleoside 2-deoxyribosyltransferase [Burkholderiaceae bacterium]
MTMKKVYLAGPDVFFPDIAQRATLHKQLCREKGFEPLHPADQPTLEAADIYHANIAMLQQADAVVANLNPFRGTEPDSGTAFEVGFATARKLRVVGYIGKRTTVRAQVAAALGPLVYDDAMGVWRDTNQNLVEDFGLPVNLMLAVPCTIVFGELADALDALRTQLS